MQENNMYKGLEVQIYLGTVRGAIAYTECNKLKKPQYNLNELDAEITALEWGRTQDEIILGNKTGIVKLYSCSESNFVKTIDNSDIEGNGPCIGLGCTDSSLIIGRKDGTINCLFNERHKTQNDHFKINGMNEDSTLEVMHLDKRNNRIATGGEKNDLKIWDIEKKSPVFKAKSLSHDELQLPVATTVRAICYFDEDNLVGCVTKEGSILLYDQRAQRKPVIKYSEPKASFTTLAGYRERKCLVGTTKGYLQLIDLRQKGKCLKTFKPFAGSVTSIVCDPFEPIVASTSLDRFLRLHNVETKELLHSEYMKMSLTKIIMRPIIKEEKADEPEDEKEVAKSKNSSIDEEYEGLFESMETVNDQEESKGLKKSKELRKLPKLVKRKKIISLKSAKKKRLSNE